jgi:hypothetical protein
MDPCEFPRPSRARAQGAVRWTLSIGWQARPKPGAYAHTTNPPTTKYHANQNNQTERSSSASSQPRKPAFSIPRSVFGWVPSWPLSSMIRKVCVSCRCCIMLCHKPIVPCSVPPENSLFLCLSERGREFCFPCLSFLKRVPLRVCSKMLLIDRLISFLFIFISPL